MINTIMNFIYNGNDVRTITIDNDPESASAVWFVAKDICDVLGLQAKYAKDRLDDDEKSYVARTDLGLTPGKQMLLINEPGLYSLVLRSRKPEAKEFKRWITHEVLPEIRFTGLYHVPDISPDFLREVAARLDEANARADEAERTKAWINDKKVASAMGTASAAKRKQHKAEAEAKNTNMSCGIVDHNSTPWFIARDVETLLGYLDSKKAVDRHCKYTTSWKDMRKGGVSSPLGLHPQLKLIPESDLYRLIMRSDMPVVVDTPEAERFQDWAIGLAEASQCPQPAEGTGERLKGGVIPTLENHEGTLRRNLGHPEGRHCVRRIPVTGPLIKPNALDTKSGGIRSPLWSNVWTSVSHHLFWGKRYATISPPTPDHFTHNPRRISQCFSRLYSESP